MISDFTTNFKYVHELSLVAQYYMHHFETFTFEKYPDLQT